MSLYARTALTLAFAFLLFQAAAFWAVYRMLIVPVAERSADDLAGLIVLSAQTWVELPPRVRPAFERELANRHGLRLQAASGAPVAEAAHFPFRNEIELALSRRQGSRVILEGRTQNHAVWVTLPVGGMRLQAGFFPDRYAVKPPAAAAVLLSSGALIVLLTALLLVRRITLPLARASRAAGVVGKGGMPEPLPETGPRELAELARRFNAMAREVQELLENRTTLLAGVSHDLRTPLTRMQLNVEMLRGQASGEKVDRLERDLAEMNGLIGGYLELARNTQAELPQKLDVDQFLRMTASRHGVHYQPSGRCEAMIAAGALNRILDNLIENAKRYGGMEPPVLQLAREGRTLRISVLDSGPGIPPEAMRVVFRPFYRLEGSRAKATGGTGLGLAIVKQLAELNGWAVTLANRPEGGLAASLALPDACG